MGFLLKNTVRSIKSSPWQTVMILFTVFLSAVLFSFSADLSSFSMEEFDLTLGAANGNADVYISSAGTSGADYITSHDVEELCEKGDAFSGYFYVPARGEGWSVLGAAADFETIGEIFDFAFLSDVTVTGADMSSGIFLTQDFAADRGVAEGDTIELDIMGEVKTFRVLGINRTYFFGSYEFLISAEAAVNLLSSVSPVFAVFDASYLPYSKAFVKLADGHGVDEFLERAEETLSGTGWRAAVVSSGSDMISLSIDVLIVVTIFLAVIVAAVVIFFSLNILSSQRKKETDTFLRSGMPPWRMNTAVATELFVYIAVGTALGLLVSYFMIPSMLGSGMEYVVPYLTGRGVAFTVICEAVAGFVSLVVYFLQGDARGGRNKAALIVSAVASAVVVICAVVLQFTPVRFKYIPAVMILFFVIALIFLLSGPVCRVLGKISPAVQRRSVGAACLCAALSGCDRVVSLHNVLRVVAVMVSLIAVLVATYDFVNGRAEREFDMVDADYFVLNADGYVVDEINAMGDASATLFTIVTTKLEGEKDMTIASCDDASFYTVDVGEIKGNDVYLPDTVTDLYGYSVGDEIVMNVYGTDRVFVLRGSTGSSVSYGYFNAAGMDMEYDMAIVRADLPGDEFLTRLIDAVSVYGAVVETFEGVFSAQIKQSDNFCDILSVYILIIGAVAVIGTLDVIVVSYLRRRGEFRVLRLSGMSGWHVARVIAFELVLILIIAAVVSAFCGWGFTRLLDITLRSFGLGLG